MSNYDYVTAVIRYEDGELTDDEMLELFQHLVDNGMAWRLQGHYGRVAQALILSGQIRSAP